MSVTVNGVAPTLAQQLEFRQAFGIESRIGEAESAAEEAKAIAESKAGASDLAGKQDALISGTNIKTVGGVSILGSGDIPLPSGGGSTIVVNDLVTGGAAAALSAEQGKALKAQVDAKADAANTTASLASKADASATAAALATKADSATVTAALAGKADSAALTAGLAAKADASALAGKQNALVSGTNIKTVGGVSLMGSGDIPLPAGGSTTAIVNDLTTGGVSAALSAEQGKTLKGQVDAKADASATTAALASKADASALAAKQNTLVSGTNIRTVGGVSLLGSGDIPLPSGGGSTVVVNDLTTGGATAALSAEQGKTLKSQVDAKADAATVTASLAGKADASALAGKQSTLVSGTNIKTVGGNSLLGSGDIPWPTVASGGTF